MFLKAYCEISAHTDVPNIFFQFWTAYLPWTETLLYVPWVKPPTRLVLISYCDVAGHSYKLYLPHEVRLISSGYSGDVVFSPVCHLIPTSFIFLPKASGVNCVIPDLQVPSGFLLLWHDQNVVHPVKQSARVGQTYLKTLIYIFFFVIVVHFIY